MTFRLVSSMNAHMNTRTHDTTAEKIAYCFESIIRCDTKSIYYLFCRHWFPLFLSHTQTQFSNGYYLMQFMFLNIIHFRAACAYASTHFWQTSFYSLSIAIFSISFHSTSKEKFVVAATAAAAFSDADVEDREIQRVNCRRSVSLCMWKLLMTVIIHSFDCFWRVSWFVFCLALFVLLSNECWMHGYNTMCARRKHFV